MSPTTPRREAPPSREPSIHLPEPRSTPGLSVAEALRARRTEREIGSADLPLQVLSNVLFAAHGVNRAHGPFGGPGYTAASVSGSSEIDVCVLLARGAYVFDALSNVLVPITGADLRRSAFGPGQPPRCPNAPVQLVYVVDGEKLAHTCGLDERGLYDAETQKAYCHVDTGIIAGNVYLFAASEGLACWFHGCDRAALAVGLALRDTQQALFAQTVGYAAKPSLDRP